MRMLHALVIIGLLLSLTAPATWAHSPAQPAASQVTPPPATATATPTAPPATAGADAPPPTVTVTATLPATPTLPTATPSPAPVLTATLPTPAPPGVAETPPPTTTPVPTITPTAALTATTATVGPEGGALTSADGRVTVQFPAGAIRQRAQVRYVPQRHTPGQPLFLVFELHAQDLTADRAISQFERALQVTLRYDEADVAGLAACGLRLFHYDPATDSWVPLQSQVDEQAHIITAWVTHFSTLAGGSGPEEVEPEVPDMRSFGTDLQTGAATINYPLALPPGRGGLTPNLSLGYSSGGADDLGTGAVCLATGQPKLGGKQVSWVGWGWSLAGLGQISLHDGNHYLSLNGTSDRLYQDAEGYWHTEKETFWRIWQEPTEYQEPAGENPYEPSGAPKAHKYMWHVLDQDGTRYDFRPLNYQVRLWGSCGTGHDTTMKSVYNGWYLVHVQDTHGNTIDISYERQWRTSPCIPDQAPPCVIEHNTKYVKAVYPKTITYGSATVTLNRAARTDLPSTSGEYECAMLSFGTERLANVEVRFAGQLVRRYVLTPGYASGRLVVSQIQLKGTDDSTTLPAYSLGYASLGGIVHLSWAENGYGGRAEYTYQMVNVPFCSSGWCGDSCIQGGMSAKYWSQRAQV
ncbi:MAG: hypothetical protein KKA73_20825, partial [Chloroflexi bacterium]|nr:hypothetical protein [Chloroflexota bacterium]